jgi:hypothetical protein
MAYAALQLRTPLPQLPHLDNDAGDAFQDRGRRDRCLLIYVASSRHTNLVAFLAGLFGWTDDVWIVDSTPIECGRSRETVNRSALAGWAAYGYRRSHSRYFWGLQLHLVCTVHGLPVAFALANPKADEREVLVSIFDVEPALLAERPRQLLIVDKGYRDAQTEAVLAARGVRLLRPAFANEPSRPGGRLLSTVRQLIESVNDTLKASSISNAMVAGPSRASQSGPCNGCWP